jgi:hypothetical protein
MNLLNLNRLTDRTYAVVEHGGKNYSVAGNTVWVEYFAKNAWAPRSRELNANGQMARQIVAFVRNAAKKA